MHRSFSFQESAVSHIEAARLNDGYDYSNGSAKRYDCS